MPIGTNVEGKMVTALRRLGFDKVFDCLLYTSAHYLDQVMDACQKVSLPEKNFSSLLAWLKCPDFNAYSLLQS